MIHLELWPTLAFVVMVLSWFAFVVTFLFHKKPPSPPDRKRDSSSVRHRFAGRRLRNRLDYSSLVVHTDVSQQVSRDCAGSADNVPGGMVSVVLFRRDPHAGKAMEPGRARRRRTQVSDRRAV